MLCFPSLSPRREQQKTLWRKTRKTTYLKKTTCSVFPTRVNMYVRSLCCPSLFVTFRLPAQLVGAFGGVFLEKNVVTGVVVPSAPLSCRYCPLSRPWVAGVISFFPRCACLSHGAHGWALAVSPTEEYLNNMGFCTIPP